MLETTKTLNWNDPTLTLENFQERAGMRFRRTKDQVARGLDRDAAFAETLNNMRNNKEQNS